MVIKSALLDNLFLGVWPLDGGLCRLHYWCASWGHFTLFSKPLSYVTIDKMHFGNVAIWLVFTPHRTKYHYFINHCHSHPSCSVAPELHRNTRFAWKAEMIHRKSIKKWWITHKYSTFFFSFFVIVYNACGSGRHTRLLIVIEWLRDVMCCIWNRLKY